MNNITDKELKTYNEAIQFAIIYMEGGCEPTSALKQAGSDWGIKMGKPMVKFITYANAILFKHSI